MTTAAKERKPDVRIVVGEGRTTRIDLVAQREKRKRKAERDAVAPPVEDTRVADVWEREETRAATRRSTAQDVARFQAAMQPARLIIDGRLRQEELQKAAHGETNKASSTVERAARAGVGNVRIDQAGVQRVNQAPLDRLYARGLLVYTPAGEKVDEGMNRILYEAGDRFRSDWYLAGLSGLGSINYNAAGGGGGDPAWGMPSSERAASYRAMWRLARHKLDEEQAAMVGGIVLDQRAIVDVAKELTRARNRRKLLLIGATWLRDGLKVLAIHYGMLKRA